MGSRPIDILHEEGSAHILNSNRTMRVLRSAPQEMPAELPDFVNLMLMLGGGLGYQIEALLAQTEIRNLCIVEPEPDIFFASLHTIDWLPILQHFAQEGRSLELVVGEEPEDCYQRLDTWISEIGGFNLVQPYVFQHLVGEKAAASFAPFTARIMPERTSFLGYFDDEQVGLAHTIRNLEAGVPLLQGSAGKTTRGKPAFIVANGPSLDASLECLRLWRDHMVLFSCGTTLGSLMKAGIRPDVHVEMERDSEMREWIAAATTPEDRAAMIGLGLNTVHPDVFGLFPTHGAAMKANDVGTAYVSGRVSRSGTVLELNNCNPTVANCATAMAAEMGFEDIYLVGVDFGFPDGDKHHSELSIHYDVRDDDQAALGMSSADHEQNIKLPGNLGGTVTTTELYKRSGAVLERSLMRHPGIKCFNVGEGLRIRDARPVRTEDVHLDNEAFDTRAAAKAIVAKAFSTDGLKSVQRADAEAVLAKTAEALERLEEVAGIDVQSVQDGLEVLSLMHEYVGALVAHPRDGYVGLMLRGSVGVFTLLLGQALHRTGDPQRNLELYGECRDLFLAFCGAARSRAETDMLASDERRRNLEAILA